MISAMQRPSSQKLLDGQTAFITMSVMRIESYEGCSLQGDTDGLQFQYLLAGLSASRILPILVGPDQAAALCLDDGCWVCILRILELAILLLALVFQLDQLFCCLTPREESNPERPALLAKRVSFGGPGNLDVFQILQLFCRQCSAMFPEGAPPGATCHSSNRHQLLHLSYNFLYCRCSSRKSPANKESF